MTVPGRLSFFQLVLVSLKGVWTRLWVLVLVSVLTSLTGAFSPLMLAPAMNIALGVQPQPAQSLQQVNLNTLGPTLSMLFPSQIAENPFSIIVITVLLYLLLVAMSASLGYISVRLTVRLRIHICRAMQNMLYQHVLRMPLTSLAAHRTGILAARISDDTLVASRGIDLAFRSLIQAIFLLVIYLGLLTLTSPGLTILFIVFGGLHAFLTLSLNRLLRRTTVANMDTQNDLRSRVYETMQSLRTVRAFNAEAFELKRFALTSINAWNAQMHYEDRRGLEMPLRWIIDAIIAGVLLITSFWLYQEGGLTITGLILFIFLARQATQPASTIGQVMVELRMSSDSTQRIIETLADPIERTTGEPITSFERDITLDRVTYEYLADIPVLKDISLTIRRGEVVGIVGPSGSGKSTLLDLILNLIEPTSGTITIDGRNVQDIKPDTYRNQFGVVFQDIMVDSASLADNISFGRPIRSQKEIERAAEIACIDHVIEALPNGYDTPAGDRGARLSGGERQRVALARAVYGRPSILVLDEATSSLDSLAEQAIQETLDEIIQHQTAIIVAHRLSTVARADKLVVLVNGRIEAIGPHHELLRTSDTYRQLAQLQLV